MLSINRSPNHKLQLVALLLTNTVALSLSKGASFRDVLRQAQHYGELMHGY
jgi:hypothetical protein